MHDRNWAVLLILVLALVVGAGSGSDGRLEAAILYVDSIAGTDTSACTDSNSPCASIQYAADQSADGDEIWVAASSNGTDTLYVGSGTDPVITLPAHDLSLKGGYAHVSLISNSWTQGINPSVVDGEHARQCLVATAAASYVLELVKFTNGSGVDGGNLRIENATVEFRGTPISGGQATRGGGLYLKDCSVSFTLGNLDPDSDPLYAGLLVIKSNAAAYGGGIYVDNSDPSISALGLDSNTASQDGGGMYLDEGNATLNGVIIAHNTAADDGGGIYSENSATLISYSRILANSAGDGGGVYAYSSSPDVDHLLVVSSSYIRQNHADGNGGGLAFRQTASRVSSSVIAENTADISGQGVWISAALIQMIHDTVADRDGNTGTAVYLTHTPGQVWPPVVPVPGHLEMKNCIIQDHATGLFVDSTGFSAPLQNSAVVDGIDWWNNTNNHSGAGSLDLQHEVFVAPAFSSTGDYPDDATPYHLGDSSPAIDAGVEPGFAESDVVADVDAQPRPMGNGYDLGADEYFSTSSALQLVPPASSESASAGGVTVVHTHYLLNTSASADSYSLSVSGVLGWTASVTPSTISVDTGAWVEIEVSVTIPPATVDGVTETTTLTATSTGDASISAQAVDSTSVDSTVARPDLWIRASGDSQWTGRDVYDPNSQYVSGTASVSAAAVYEFTVENDGNSADSFRIAGPGGDADWNVQYFDALSGGTDISAAVTGAGWDTGSLAAGGTSEFRAEVRPAASAVEGAQFSITLTATSAADPSVYDGVSAVTTAQTADAEIFADGFESGDMGEWSSAAGS